MRLISSRPRHSETNRIDAVTVLACSTGSAPYAGSSSTVRSVMTKPGRGNSRNSTLDMSTGRPSEFDIARAIRLLYRLIPTSGGITMIVTRIVSASAAIHNFDRQ